MIIRPATPADRLHLRRAVVELQEFERRLHASRLPGEQVADAYLDWLLGQSGTILLAESGGDFAGFAAGHIETEANLGETSDSNRFGLISDVCVMPAFRGQRIAQRLLDAADSELRRAGVTRVRINALAAKAAARTSYARAGFARLRLTTTNDNLSALRFYMRRRFRLVALRPGAVDEARRRKPSISLIGRHGIPIHDEIELCLALD